MARYSIKGVPYLNWGKDVSDCITSEEVIKKADLGWHVAKAKCCAKLPLLGGWDKQSDGTIFPDIINGNEFKEIPNQYATYRTDKNIPLGFVKKDYEVVQNSQAFNFFDDCSKYGVKWETAGRFGYGERIYASCKLPKEIHIGGQDTVGNYLIFINGHDGKSAVNILLSPVRILCQNALNPAVKAAEQHIRFKHHKGVNDKIFTAKDILGITEEKIKDVEECYNFLFKKKMKEEDVKKYIANVFLNEGQLNTLYEKSNDINLLFGRDFGVFKKLELSQAKMNVITDVYDYYKHGIGQEEIRNTMWGAYNSVTGYFANVKKFSSEEKRLTSTILSTDSNKMQNALEIAVNTII